MKLILSALVLAVVLSVAGCGDDETTAPAADSPREVAELLAEAGYACENFERIAEPPFSARAASCEFDGVFVTLLAFEGGEAQLDALLAFAEDEGCDYFAQRDYSAPWVIGPDWLIDAESEELATELADATGAELWPVPEC